VWLPDGEKHEASRSLSVIAELLVFTRKQQQNVMLRETGPHAFIHTKIKQKSGQQH